MLAALAKPAENWEFSWLLVVLVSLGQRMLLSRISAGSTLAGVVRLVRVCTLGAGAGTLGAVAGILGADSVGTLGAGAVCPSVALLRRKKVSRVVIALLVGVPCCRKGVAGCFSCSS